MKFRDWQASPCIIKILRQTKWGSKSSFSNKSISQTMCWGWSFYKSQHLLLLTKSNTWMKKKRASTSPSFHPKRGKQSFWTKQDQTWVISRSNIWKRFNFRTINFISSWMPPKGKFFLELNLRIIWKKLSTLKKWLRKSLPKKWVFWRAFSKKETYNMAVSYCHTYNQTYKVKPNWPLFKTPND